MIFCCQRSGPFKLLLSKSHNDHRAQAPVAVDLFSLELQIVAAFRVSHVPFKLHNTIRIRSHSLKSAVDWLLLVACIPYKYEGNYWNWWNQSNRIVFSLALPHCTRRQNGNCIAKSKSYEFNLARRMMTHVPRSPTFIDRLFDRIGRYRDKNRLNPLL